MTAGKVEIHRFFATKLETPFLKLYLTYYLAFIKNLLHGKYSLFALQNVKKQL